MIAITAGPSGKGMHADCDSARKEFYLELLQLFQFFRTIARIIH
jgi:hypothetical protein